MKRAPRKIPKLPGEGVHFTVERYATREEWLAARAGRDVPSLGSSDASVPWDVSPYGTQASLWLEKTGRAPRIEDDAEWLELGNVLEDPIAQLAAKRTGRRIEDWGRFTILRSLRWPWLTCTLDRFQWVEGVPFGPLEVKNRGAFTDEDWREGVPLHIELQATQQMIVGGWSHASVAVLLGGAKLEVFEIELDPEFAEMHIEKTRAFVELVKSDTPPPLDGSTHLSAALRSAALLAPDAEVALPQIAEIAIELVQAVRAEEKRIKAAKAEAENHLMMALALGGGTRGRLPDGTLVTIAKVERAAYHVEASSYVQLRVKAPKVRALKTTENTPLIEAAREE